MTDWLSLFEEVVLKPPAVEADIRALSRRLAEPPSASERSALIANQSNPFNVKDPLHQIWQPLDPSSWQMPSSPLPASYLDFLRWSDGPWVRRGRREFGFFGSSELRNLVLGYHFPYFMPAAVPIGLDGGGLFAVFDTRGGAAEEYPILGVEAGVFDYGAAKPLATSFLEFCTGTTSVSDVLFPPVPEAENPGRPVRLILTTTPPSTRLIGALHRTATPESRLADLLALCRRPPAILIDSLPSWRAEQILSDLPPELSACLAVEDPIDTSVK
jgi:hypothetical protein